MENAKYPNKIFGAKLFKSEVVALGIKKFTFKLEEPFTSLPWQYVWVEIPEMKIADPRGSRRAFSIFNSISEENKIEIIARISDSGYKQDLFALGIGDSVRIHGPFGSSFVVNDSRQPKQIIMIAGGVGISAFMPMLEVIRSKGYPINCYLVYLNKDKESTPFLKELETLKAGFNNFDYKVKYDYFIWNDIADLVKKSNDGIEWWITGPKSMVEHVYEILEKGGVSRVNMIFENYYPIPSYSLTKEMIGEQMLLENPFSRAIENSTNHTIITDVEGTILYANKAAQSITGYSQEEMYGNTPRLWGGMMSAEFYVNFWKKKKSGQPFTGEIVNRRKNGEIYYAIAHIAPIINKKGELTGYIGTEEDITERVKLQDEINESKNFLNSVIENLPNMLFVKDAKDLKFVLFNKAGEELIGLSANQVLGKGDYDFFPKEQADFFVGKDRQVLNEGKLSDIPEESIDTKNKGKRILHTKKIPLFDLKGKSNYLLGISEDITHEKEVQEEIKSLTNRLKLATESARIGVWEWDIEKDTLVSTDSMTDLFGVDLSKKENSAFMAWQSMIHPEDKDNTAKNLQNSIGGQDKKFDINYRIIRPDGVVVAMRSIANLSRDNNGKALKAVGVNIDITKEYELDKSKSEFISIASHQLRTPVTALNWLIEALNSGSDNFTPKQKGYIKELYDATKRLIDLVEDLLSISRVQLKSPATTEKEKIDILDFVSESIGALKTYGATKKHEIVFNNMLTEKILLDINKKGIYNVMQNLISNAIEYSPADTKVSVSLEKTEGFIKISVANEGPSIAEKDQHRIFERFFRTEEAKKMKTEGTGLGLYLVKTIVEENGGTVGFQSPLLDKEGEPNKEKNGTVFWFTIPTKGAIINQ